MAKFIKKSSHLEQQYRSSQHRSLRFGLLSLLGLFITAAGIAPQQPVLLVIGLCWFTVCMMLTLLPVRNLSSLKAGIRGEQNGAELLQSLPDSYLCLQNATVPYRGKESETDLIVAGPTGVFIIEVKNRNGHITGDAEDKNWVQHKVGRAGGEYESAFYNPTKQVGTHIYRLAHYLRERGCRVHIDGAVLFPNPETTLSLSGDKEIPVFSGKNAGKDLLDHIRRGDDLPPETVRQIRSLLAKL